MKDNNEVRIKLHITKSNDTNVRNMWMCLNYNQKPTIKHIIQHIKESYGLVDKKEGEDDECVKLYMEDYWLPPHENSKLIRENDCIKVEIKITEEKDISAKSSGVVKSTNKSLSTKSGDINDKLNLDKQLDQTKYVYNNNLFDPYTHQYSYYQQPQNVYYATQDTNPPMSHYTDYYKTKDYYETEKNNNKHSNLYKNTNMSKSKSSMDYSDSVVQKDTKKPQEKEKVKEKDVLKQQESSKTKPLQSGQTAKNSQKEIANCYKKFAIGSYVNMLRETQNEDNESLSEEQIIDDYYQTIQKTKTDKKDNKVSPNKKKDDDLNAKQYSSESVNVDKIASNINSSGKAKWKNSTKQTTQSNGPKHIRFASSSDTSSDSSSSSSSSDSSEDEVEAKKKQPIKEKKDEPEKPKEKTNKNGYYEPSKEQQLNAVSTNKSYVIENPKELGEFRKMFNQAKLNAPKPEEFMNKPEEAKKEENGENLNESVSSTCSTSSVDDEGKKKTKREKRSPSPKIDYEKLQPLIGAPRLKEKIAFQILEISSNFTPEISKYKNGTVVDFDANTNEITLNLHSKYNSVLKKPNKFNVVLDETDEEMNRLKKNENLDEPEQEEQPEKHEEILKIDWRNLMNVKLL